VTIDHRRHTDTYFCDVVLIPVKPKILHFTAVFHVPEAHPEIYEKTMGDGIFEAETQRTPRFM
jgi:hypothetical protein